MQKYSWIRVAGGERGMMIGRCRKRYKDVQTDGNGKYLRVHVDIEKYWFGHKVGKEENRGKRKFYFIDGLTN